MRDPKKISSELLIIFFIFANVKKQSGMLDRTFFLPLIIRLLTTGGGASNCHIFAPCQTIVRLWQGVF